MRRVMIVAVGIDVGGPQKGFHAAALRDGAYLDKLHSTDAAAITAWVRRLDARAVAVDAPCHWRANAEHMRPAEHGLARLRIHCFATPTRKTGESHPFYTWMRNGLSLYARLTADYPLLQGSARAGSRACFETFPQAIACLLAGRLLPARNKRLDRPRLLQAAGIDTGPLDSLDFVDAALCALAARLYLTGKFRKLGDPVEGYIVLPA